ncbi:hypothetical protein [Desulfotruncus alcoholivorax]|uniref:hypothetical protein n=1 Tax=Desulfotruncus alcoholivorax TaxID=265477 RepID=UPI0003FE34B2|nr:hypothetical protein [Desulfotruncus alcoholivorax]
MENKRKLCWVTGTITAFAGVFTVRVLSLQVPDNLRFGCMLTGFSMAILGLFIITLGTRRR